MYDEYETETEKTHLTSLLLINTKQKRDMVQRGYKLNVTNRDLTTVQQTIEQFGKVSTEAIATQTPGILTMGMNPDLQVTIANGWQTERFIFILKTKTVRSDGNVLASYIQGYTDHAGVTRTGQMDPNMTFYINNIINVIEAPKPGTNMVSHIPHSAFTLVYDRISNTKTLRHDENTIKLLRPIDALVELHAAEQYDEVIPVTNVMSKVGHIVNTSKANNRIPSNQISSIINGVISAASMTTYTSDASDIYIGSAGLVSEFNVSDVPFMRELSFAFGRNVGEFTLGELQGIDPNVLNVVDVKWTIPEQVNIDQTMLQANEQNILLTNDPESLSVTTPEARIASIISESCSGIISNLLLTSIMFTVQSGIITNEPIFTPLNYNSEIPVVNPEAAVMEFERMFNTLVLPQITENGMVMVDILVNIDLINESRVSVSVNNNPPVVFAIPTYSNSLFDPVITTSNGLHDGLNQYKSLLSLVVK